VGFVKVKFLPLVSLALTAPLLLTGCATSPSLEEQTKLIEYEKCLDFQQRRASWGFDLANLRSNFDRVNVQDDYVTLYKALQNYRFQQLLKDCEEYRP
jgi:hypothetical protein